MTAEEIIMTSNINITGEDFIEVFSDNSTKVIKDALLSGYITEDECGKLFVLVGEVGSKTVVELITKKGDC